MCVIDSCDSLVVFNSRSRSRSRSPYRRGGSPSPRLVLFVPFSEHVMLILFAARSPALYYNYSTLMAVS